MKYILLIVDVPNWAWSHKAHALKKHLESDDIKFDVVCPNEKYDVNKYHHIHSFSYFLSHLSKFNSSTTVASHNFELKDDVKLRLNKINRFRKIVCVSPFIYDNLKKNGISENKLYKCYNGVDETLFFPINRKFPLNRPIVVGWCGQPYTKKGDQHGFHIMEKIMEKLNNNKNFSFLINRKTYKTAIPFDKMNSEYYNKIDIIIHTGLATGTPNTVFEAVASGAMAIGTRIGCMEELITDGINGFLFDRPKGLSSTLTAQEVNDCSEKIVNCLLHLEKNRNIIKVFSQKIREIVLKNWTWNQRSKDWKEILEI